MSARAKGREGVGGGGCGAWGGRRGTCMHADWRREAGAGAVFGRAGKAPEEEDGGSTRGGGGGARHLYERSAP
eukprot:363347-Chlamydomonas_euryale.AAC.1